MLPEEEIHYRVKVFIPAFYEVFGAEIMIETIKEAVVGLEAVHYKIEPELAGDGAWLYLFGAHLFPYVANGEETPDGVLWLSASEGWKVKWSKLIKSPILTMH